MSCGCCTEGLGRLGSKKCKKGMKTQSVLFPRSKWTQKQARVWLLAHGMVAAKVDATANYYRYRQVFLGRCEKSSFRVIPFGGKIKAVVCCPK